MGGNSYSYYTMLCEHSDQVSYETKKSRIKIIIRHVNVQSCLLIIFQDQPISLQYSWLGVEQPIRIDWVLHKHLLEFPINKKIIPM